MSLSKSHKPGRSRRALITLTTAAVTCAALVVQSPAADASGFHGQRTANVGVVPFSGDVYTPSSNGTLIPVLPDSTPLSAPLFNLAGNPLNVTWGQFSSATATSLVKTITRKGVEYTDFKIALSGLIPNGVYSLFYRTFSPDSNNAFCPNVEPSVALTARHPNTQNPDASSFVAESSGAANFHARVAGALMDAQQVLISVIYHFDGHTYGPVANAAEANGPVAGNGGLCRSSYGIDAMRQLLIIQK
jgi:hypothetical protein